MPRFVATTRAYVNDCLIETGTQFDYPYCPGDWAVPLAEYKAKEKEAEEDEQMTLNEAVTGKRRPKR